MGITERDNDELADQLFTTQQDLKIAQDEVRNRDDKLRTLKEELKQAYVDQEELEVLRGKEKEVQTLRVSVAENSERLKELFSLRKKYAILEGDAAYFKEQELLLRKKVDMLNHERNALNEKLQDYENRIVQMNEARDRDSASSIHAASEEEAASVQKMKALEDELFELKVVSDSRKLDYENDVKALQDKIELQRTEIIAKTEALAEAERTVTSLKVNAAAVKGKNEDVAVLEESRKWMRENTEVRNTLCKVIKQMSIQRHQFNAAQRLSRESQKQLQLKEIRLQKLQASFQTLLKDLDNAQEKYKMLELESAHRIGEKEEIIKLLCQRSSNVT